MLRFLNFLNFLNLLNFLLYLFFFLLFLLLFFLFLLTAGGIQSSFVCFFEAVNMLGESHLEIIISLLDVFLDGLHLIFVKFHFDIEELILALLDSLDLL